MFVSLISDDRFSPMVSHLGLFYAPAYRLRQRSYRNPRYPMELFARSVASETQSVCDERVSDAVATQPLKQTFNVDTFAKNDSFSSTFFPYTIKFD